MAERLAMMPWVVAALAVWLVDRLTKAAIVQTLRLGEELPLLPWLSWVRLHNEGAAFSLLAEAGGWQRWLFIVIAIAFSVYLIYELRRLRPGEWHYAAAFALILGGAWGNLYDRAMDGYVVDFVLVHYRHSYFFPAFNVADAAITVGAALWIVLLLAAAWRQRESDAP